ncbi:MAG TPA: GNAT family N-acetyltransferase [Ktedonosporobacter sp.]|nr:GNAT family N-acetyltransferase [Ktedonosporobacter sp.]
MRIRHYRPEYLETLVQIEHQAAQSDGRGALALEERLTDPEEDDLANVFVITDDDDEVNPWGQAGTLDGLEGEVVGYTILQLHKGEQGYHFLCQGAVHPQYRRQHGGRVLLVGALNRARVLAEEFEFEAEEAGLSIYFEALLPNNDPASARLAARCELQATTEVAPEGLILYRREL